MSVVKVQKITEPMILGEGPHWDVVQQALYFVCIDGQTIHKYVPASGLHTTSAKLEGRVGFVVPVEGATDQYLVGVEREFLVVQWDGLAGTPVKVVRKVGDVDHGTKNRINDGKADPKGRVFAGTMGHEEGSDIEMQTASLFRIDGSGVTKVVYPVTVSNGLAWALDGKAFYYTDSLEYKIRRYDYDIDTGEISNMTYIFDLKENNIEGIPDGTTIDTDGNLWVAIWTGSCVIKIDPNTGKILQKVPIPAYQVTSVVFGGPDLDILFVTSANTEGDQKPPPCGATFMVTGLGVKGVPCVKFKF